jgi:glutamate-1-semialdehyde 2,1-aminomutase
MGFSPLDPCFLEWVPWQHLTFFAHDSTYTLNSYKDFVVAPYNDISETDAIASKLPPDSLAAIIVEPMQVSGGCIQGTDQFLQHLRRLATTHNAVLIFDEVMTSRLHHGGLQVKLDIKPDITTIGKWAGGGMSFGAFGGRRKITQMFDPRENKLHHSGTFNNNNVTMAAGIAGCTIMDAALTNSLNERGDRLRYKIEQLIEKRLPAMSKSGYVGTKMATRGLGSLFVVGFVGPENSSLQALLYHYLLERGIYIAVRGFFALTIEITDQHFEPLLSALDGFIDRYEAVLT